MRKALFWLIGILVLVVALGIVGRTYATGYMNRHAVNAQPMGASTPESRGMTYSRVAFPSGDRTLIGWWVRAESDSGAPAAPALLFFHGNSSAISDYVPLQAFLHRQGISSFVFDYTGFGASGGTPSLANAIADAGAAARVFEDSAGVGARKVAFGSAMGSTVLLQAIDSIQPHVSGVVIEGVAASVRESAVRDGQIPAWMAPLLVDIADNVQAARNVRVPLLAIHSYADNRFPISDAQRVVDAVRSRSALVRHWRAGHSAILTSSRTCDWQPVLAFVKQGTMPAAPFDTVNACATAAASDTTSDTTAVMLPAPGGAARQPAPKP